MSSTLPNPPREQLYNRYCSNKHNNKKRRLVKQLPKMRKLNRRIIRMSLSKEVLKAG